MIYQKVQALLRKIFPRFITEPIRSVATGLLTPLEFSIRTGHFKSSLLGKSVDVHGNPIPWYTYPIIEFLKSKNFSNCTVLEFGSGQSTLWWADRAKKVTSLEDDQIWLEKFDRQALANVDLHYIPTNLTGLEAVVGHQNYDVIIVDGLYRPKAAEKAEQMVASNGVIIVDNSEQLFSKPEGLHCIADFFRSKGYRRIDFYGHSPGVILPHCTSIFFKEDCFLLKGEENPMRIDI